jgi:hypothetical protein
VRGVEARRVDRLLQAGAWQGGAARTSLALPVGDQNVHGELIHRTCTLAFRVCGRCDWKGDRQSANICAIDWRRRTYMRSPSDVTLSYDH